MIRAAKEMWRNLGLVVNLVDLIQVGAEVVQFGVEIREAFGDVFAHLNGSAPMCVGEWGGGALTWLMSA